MPIKAELPVTAQPRRRRAKRNRPAVLPPQAMPCRRWRRPSAWLHYVHGRPVIVGIGGIVYKAIVNKEREILNGARTGVGAPSGTAPPSYLHKPCRRQRRPSVWLHYVYGRPVIVGIGGIVYKTIVNKEREILNGARTGAGAPSGTALPSSPHKPCHAAAGGAPSA